MRSRGGGLQEGRRFEPLHVVLALGVVGIVFGPYLASGFLLDDYFHLEHLLRHDGLRALQFSIDTDDQRLYLWPVPDGVRFVYFRPLVKLSLWFDWQLWGLHAWGFHLTNILLHLVNVWLLHRVAMRLGLGRTAARTSALVWGVSVHAIPSVGWISGRTEILAAMFAFLSMLAFLRWRDAGGGRWFGITLLCIVLGFGAKESAVVVPLLLLLIDRFPANRRAPMPALRVAALCIPSLIYVMLRLLVFPPHLPPAPYFQLPGSPADTGLFAVHLLVYALSALLSLPLLPLAPVDFLTARPLLVVALVVLAAALLATLVRWTGRTVGLLLVAWFLVALMPYAPVMPTSLYLYVPTAAIALMLGVAMTRTTRRAPTVWITCLVTVGAVANVTTGLLLRRVSGAVEASVATVAQVLEDPGVSQVVFIDTPVWFYALPPAVKLREASREFEAYFLNFVSGLLPAEPSVTQWRDDGTLTLHRGDTPFFDSSVERFMLFGAQPRAEQVVTRGPIGKVSVISDSSRASSLRFEFVADEQSATRVIQFHGWRAVILAAPGMPAR